MSHKADYTIDYRIDRLNASHDFSNFDCMDDDLNEFIREDALNYQEDNVSVTYVCIHDSKCVGYITISNDAILINNRDKKEFSSRGINIPDFPAIKIGRWARDKEYKGRDVGKQLLYSVFKTALALSKVIGIRFISVDAYPAAINTYLRYDFQPHYNSVRESIEKTLKSEGEEYKTYLKDLGIDTTKLDSLNVSNLDLTKLNLKDNVVFYFDLNKLEI